MRRCIGGQSLLETMPVLLSELESELGLQILRRACTERLQGVVMGVVTTKMVVTTQGGVVTTPPF